MSKNYRSSLLQQIVKEAGYILGHPANVTDKVIESQFNGAIRYGVDIVRFLKDNKHMVKYATRKFACKKQKRIF